MVIKNSNWLRGLLSKSKRTRQRKINHIAQNIPEFPNFIARSWIRYQFNNDPIVDQTIYGLIAGGEVSRVVFRWQYESSQEYWCLNPIRHTSKDGKITPKPVININDLCPLYKRKIRKGYARPPQEYLDLVKKGRAGVKVWPKFS